MAKKRRTAAQRRATAKMIAANRRRAGGKRRASRKTPKRKGNPSRRAASGYTVGSTKTHRIRRRKLNPSRRRARRRNPSSLPTTARGFAGQLVPALIGGAGALALDVGLAMAPLPVQFKTGLPRTAVRIVGAIGMGWAVGKLLRKPRLGGQLAAGALTVVAYDELKAQAAKMLGGKVPGIGLYDIPGIGMYEVQPAEQEPMVMLPDGSMGYWSSAQQVGNEQGEYIDG